MNDKVRREPITFAEFTEHFAPKNRRPGRRDTYVDNFEAIRDTFQPGDELWVVVSDKASWRHLMGRARIEHIRCGSVIHFLGWKMN